MELAGEVTGSENKRWAKCKKCKHTMVIDLIEDVKETKVSLEGIENEDCIKYSPEKSYEVGQSIYHENWNDFGKVVAKETLSNGHPGHGRAHRAMPERRTALLVRVHEGRQARGRGLEGVPGRPPDA